MHIILHEPRIPPNTGNIIRLCVNIGAPLHLIHPLGFSIDDRQLRRAGLDYAERAVIREWANYDSWHRAHPGLRLLAATRNGDTRYDEVRYCPNDALLFGCETGGLPPEIVTSAAAAIRIPMRPGNRSLNLSNSVAVVAYEAWRQQDFA